MDIQQLYTQIRKDEQTDEKFLHLTSNEPYVSNMAKAFANSRLADRYYFGGGDDELVDFGAFTSLGMPGVSELIKAAEEATKEMLGASAVNLNCLSGVHAMMCAILSTTEPGDMVMTVGKKHGGHFATKGIVDRIGRKHVFTPAYDYDGLKFDADAIAKTFKEQNCKALYLDVSYYLNPHNLHEMRAALGDEAIIIYDASHTIGLVMGQQFQAPFKEGADVICANTHKTLPGPQKGLIAFRDKELGEKANAIIDGCLYSSPHTASMIALATTILEMKEFGQDFAKQIITNSNALGEALNKRGYHVRKANTGRWSENHQVHLMTHKIGKHNELWRKLYGNHINVNFDSPDVFEQDFFIRLGTQEITRRGMKEAEMDVIADFLQRGLSGYDFADEVTAFVDKYRTAHYSFDER